jgi:hypothetical protein
VRSLSESGASALPLAAAIVLPALLATPALAAVGSTSIEPAPSSWEASGSGLKLPLEGLDAGTPLEPQIRIRLSSLVLLKSDKSVSHSQLN